MLNDLFTAIYERYRGIYSNCVRAFNFNGDCVDETGTADGTATSLTYTTGKHGILQAADFDGAASLVNIGKASDINSLSTFTVIAYIYPVSDGEANTGVIYSKDTSSDYVGFWVSSEAGGNVAIEGRVPCATTPATAKSTTVVPINTWTLVAMTWNNSTKLVSLFINEAEVSYAAQVTGVGTRLSDASNDGIIGNLADASRTFDGAIDTFRLYNAVLPVARMGWFMETPLYFQEAPQTSAFPYVVFFLVDNVPHWSFADTFETARMQFSAFCEETASPSGAKELGIIKDGVKQCFDDKQIDVTSYNSIICRREGETQFKPDEIWQGTIDYLIELQTA